MMNEFDESDMSDYEYEEAEDPCSESDFEKDDEHQINKDCIAACSEESYNGFWVSSAPQSPFKQFNSQTPQAGPTAKFATKKDAFFALLSPGIINIILECTNSFIVGLKKKLQRKGSTQANYCEPTNASEVHALIGLWLKLGITGQHNSSVKEIFSSKPSSLLDAHLCFSYNRYTILMRCIRFDQKYKRKKNPDDSWKDKFVHIREVFDIFTRNTKEAYKPGKHLTVDEILLSFRGKFSFRMFIPCKRAKFGIKIYWLVDPTNMYLSNAEIYLGKQQEMSSGGEIVIRLAKDFLGCSRTIVTDNFFTSSDLGTSLWQSNTYLLGTIRKNRTGNPKDFFKEPLQTGKLQFVFQEKGFSQETLLKFQVRNTKQVRLYSTVHHAKDVHQSGKPEMIVDYNKAKFGVDIFDEMLNGYSYKPETSRWPLRIFMSILVDGGALNAHILHGGKQSRRDFLYNLSDQLMEAQIAVRGSSNHWSTNIFRQISALYNILCEIFNKITYSYVIVSKYGM